MIISAEQWLNEDAHRETMNDVYATVYEDYMHSPEVVSSLTRTQETFGMLIRDFTAQLRAHSFSDHALSAQTAIGRIDCITSCIFHLENLTQQFREAKPVASYTEDRVDPFVHHVLYELLRDIALTMPVFAGELQAFIEKIQATEFQRSESRKFMEWIAEDEAPTALFPSYQGAMDRSLHYEQRVFPALAEAKTIHSLRIASDRLQPFTTLHVGDLNPEHMYEAGVSMHAAFGAKRYPSVHLSADRDARIICMQLPKDSNAIHLFTDGRVLQEGAPPYLLSGNAPSMSQDAASLTDAAYLLYASTVSTVESLYPELLREHRELLNGCIVLRENDQYYILSPLEIAHHLPRTEEVQEVPTEQVAALLQRLGMDEEMDARNMLCLALPTFDVLERKHFVGEHIEGEFAKGADPAMEEGGHGTGGGSGARSLSLQRMMVLRNTLLANRDSVGRVRYSWDEDTTPSFSTVDRGRYTIVTLSDLGVQFVVSDDADKAVYALMGDVLLVDQYTQQAITPSWLRSVQAQPLYWENPLQFSRVLTQALAEREMTLSPQGYPSVQALVDAERSQILRLLDRVARFNNHLPASKEPVEASGLTTHHFRKIASGDCGLYCGDAVLNHLISKSGEELSRAGVLQRIQEQLFPVSSVLSDGLGEEARE
ncbi:MAG: hypothetical protein Greene101449_965 [Candidatus Peregrinibacteria bacterium Greene1014_49]|nr:MAG: hypothetical protein Greene101449_965 [Candidatus Peregrinibacteria bacterium Greene1014_49]